MISLLRVIKDGLLNTFYYRGKETRGRYLVFFSFQLLWFGGYLAWNEAAHGEMSLPVVLLFILPTFACGARRANDAGYSRGVIALLVIAPYLLFPFLLFPSSVKPKEERH